MLGKGGCWTQITSSSVIKLVIFFIRSRNYDRNYFAVDFSHVNPVVVERRGLLFPTVNNGYF